MIDRARFIRPSSLPGIAACAGRPLMEARACAAVPALESLSSHAAQQGTLGHTVAAQTLTLMYGEGGPRMEAAAALAHMAGALSQLEEWSREACRACVGYVAKLVDVFRASHWTVTVLIELKLSGKGVHIARGGSVDVILLLSDKSHQIRRVVVEDHKMGWLDQGEAADHQQLSCYAMMAADKFKPDLGVDVHLAQGRRKDFTCAHYSTAAIEAVRTETHRMVASAEAAAPLLRPSIAGCRYCKALPLCAAARSYVMDAADEFALLGCAPEDRLRLAEQAAVAKRFHEAAGELAKIWRNENAAADAAERAEQ